MADGTEPLPMGHAVGLTGRVIRRNIGAIAAVCLVVAVLTVVLGWGAKAGLSAAFPMAYGPGADTAMRSALNFIVSVVTTAGVTRIALADLDGGKASAGQALRASARFALPLLGLNIVLTLGVGLAAVLLLVPGIMLALRWAVAVPALMVEALSINDCTRRSAELTAGNRWRILGLFVALYTGILIAAVAVVILAEVLSLNASVPQPVLDVMADIATNTVATALTATLAAVCYAELRRIREGATPGQVAAVFA